MSTELTGQMVELLNEILASDGRAISQLFTARVLCNEKIANHPHVVCEPVGAFGRHLSSVGLLGIINGFLSKMGQPKVAMTLDYNTHQISGFTQYNEGVTDGQGRQTEAEECD